MTVQTHNFSLESSPEFKTPTRTIQYPGSSSSSQNQRINDDDDDDDDRS